MQLMRLADVPLDKRDRKFYYSRFRAVLGTTILIAVALGALGFGWRKNVWLAYYVAAVVAICLLIFQRLVTARFRSTNWLVQMTDHGLYIKFRSYLNHHFPDQDPTVFFLPHSEIRSARSVTERQEVLDRDDQTNSAMTKTRRLVVLELAGDSTKVAEALDNERRRVFSKSFHGGGANSRYQHLPVRLACPNFLIIEWGVVPSVQSILEALTRHTLVQPGEETTRDFVNLDGLSRGEQEARLLELAESGDMIGAVAIARKLYSYDLTTAKTFVESLIHKQRKRLTNG